MLRFLIYRKLNLEQTSTVNLTYWRMQDVFKYSRLCLLSVGFYLYVLGLRSWAAFLLCWLCGSSSLCCVPPLHCWVPLHSSSWLRKRSSNKFSISEAELISEARMLYSDGFLLFTLLSSSSSLIGSSSSLLNLQSAWFLLLTAGFLLFTLDHIM